MLWLPRDPFLWRVVALLRWRVITPEQAARLCEMWLKRRPV